MIQPDPTGTIHVVLDRHRAQTPPGASPPYYIFKALSRRETRRLSQFARAAAAARDTIDVAKAETMLDDCEQFIRENLRGWSGITDLDGRPVEYDPADFDRTITDRDLGELTAKLRFGGLTEDDLKNSDSPSPSPTAPVATHPDVAGPDATASPTTTIPSKSPAATTPTTVTT